jgi:hypothetical protein
MTTSQLFRIILKTILLFIVINALWVVLQPMTALESLSLYNVLVEGRTRLPYGLNGEDYNLSPSRLGTMFATHEINRPKASDEYRVVVLGDSSVWGILLRPEETLTGQLNTKDLVSEDGRQIRFYNLAYPMNSVLKDQLLLNEALRYQPDLIVWLVTLESLAYDNQLEPPLLQANPSRVNALIRTDDLPLDPLSEETPLWDQTLIGQRRMIAEWLRLQAYGGVWSATGIDQIYKDYTPRSNDFDTDITWHGLSDDFTAETLAFPILRGGVRDAASVPVVFINEPIYIANGTNSDLHYNAWSPRWAYDYYRTLFAETVMREGWAFHDAWDVIPSAEFTDSPVHLTPQGSSALADWIADQIFKRAE